MLSSRVSVGRFPRDPDPASPGAPSFDGAALASFFSGLAALASFFSALALAGAFLPPLAGPPGAAAAAAASAAGAAAAFRLPFGFLGGVRCFFFCGCGTGPAAGCWKHSPVSHSRSPNSPSSGRVKRLLASLRLKAGQSYL